MTIGIINRGDLVLIRADNMVGLYLVVTVDQTNARVTVRPLGDEPLIRSWPMLVPLSRVFAVYAATSTA